MERPQHVCRDCKDILVQSHVLKKNMKRYDDYQVHIQKLNLFFKMEQLMEDGKQVEELQLKKYKDDVYLMAPPHIHLLYEAYQLSPIKQNPHGFAKLRVLSPILTTSKVTAQLMVEPDQRSKATPRQVETKPEEGKPKAEAKSEVKKQQMKKKPQVDTKPEVKTPQLETPEAETKPEEKLGVEKQQMNKKQQMKKKLQAKTKLEEETPQMKNKSEPQKAKQELKKEGGANKKEAPPKRKFKVEDQNTKAEDEKESDTPNAKRQKVAAKASTPDSGLKSQPTSSSTRWNSMADLTKLQSAWVEGKAREGTTMDEDGNQKFTCRLCWNEFCSRHVLRKHLRDVHILTPQKYASSSQQA